MTEENNQTILSTLSEIRANLAVNSSETANIKENIREIKVDIKEIKAGSITRAEFDDHKSGINRILTTHSTEIEGLIGTKNKMIGALILLQIVWGFVIFLVSKYG